jgi:hypothetical protein
MLWRRLMMMMDADCVSYFLGQRPPNAASSLLIVSVMFTYNHP